MRPRRPGVTLVEVLVAIFIMGIGMLAILVLFPLGALNMARALKDDRCGAIAANADSMAQGRGLRSDPALLTAVTQTPAGFPPPLANGPSYPVYVDPYYAITGLTTLGTAPTPIQRITPDYIRLLPNPPNPPNTGNPNQYPDIDRWFSFQDDLSFETNGLPMNFANGNSLQRQGYYTWAYCMQRSETGLPSTEQMTVIVYQGRSVATPIAEQTFTTPGAVANSTSLTLTPLAGGARPSLRRGNWLMGITARRGTVATGLTSQMTEFYRVLDAVTIAGVTTVEVAVAGGSVIVNPPLQVVLLDSAVEVFPRGSSGR